MSKSWIKCIIDCMNKLQKSIFLIFFIFVCFACENKEVVENQNIEPEIQFVKTDGLTDIPLWIPGNYPRIAVVFGHGYETEETQVSVLAVLEENFGLAENQGLIIPLTFPKVYFENKRVRNAWLREALVGQDVCAIITLAAPAKTHFALADLQDNGFTGKVYSVFPQDDELGTESGSEFVLKYKSLGIKLDESPVYVIDSDKDIASVVSKNYEEEASFKQDITKVLIPIIKRIKSYNKSTVPETPANFATYLKKCYEEIFPDSTLTPNVDPQTGIKSLNHYVLGVYDE